MVSSLEKTAGTIPSEPPPSRYLQWDRYCERILVFLALAILTPPPQARQAERARTQFDCTTTKVIMTNKAGQTGSVQVEEHMTFWIDDAAKALFFLMADGCELLASTNPGLVQEAKISSTSSIAPTVRLLTPGRQPRIATGVHPV
jgi:hypothetical protein